MLCTIELLGFPPNDQRTLTATFSLSARRQTAFTQWQPTAALPPDVLLVDADNAEAMVTLARRKSSGSCPMPVVAVATAPPAQVSHFLERPIRFLPLFKMLDQVLLRSGEALPKATSDMSSQTPVTSEDQTNSAGEELGSAAASAQFSPVLTEALLAAKSMARLSANSHRSTPTTPGKPAYILPAERSGKNNKQLSDWVLVVDDNLAVRRFMAQKLEQFSINVDFAATGEQAIGLTGAKHYTCIFLDVIMPGIDGYQVCKLIKGNRVSKDVKIVMLTSRDSPFDKIRGKMAGCDAYLTKPVDEEKLLNTIVRFLPEGAMINDVLEKNSSFHSGSNG